MTPERLSGAAPVPAVTNSTPTLPESEDAAARRSERCQLEINDIDNEQWLSATPALATVTFFEGHPKYLPFYLAGVGDVRTSKKKHKYNLL